jgi:hydroxymethylpyrimidine/phosphomethylpyrimidine kinase
MDAIRGDLLSIVDWITPNIPEAKRLTGWEREVSNIADMRDLAVRLAEVCNVPTILLKGGHLTLTQEDVSTLGDDCTVIWCEGDPAHTTEVLTAFRSYMASTSRGELVVDIMITKGELVHTLFVGNRVESTSTHGTGCTLSSALACVWAIAAQDQTTRGELFRLVSGTLLMFHRPDIGASDGPTGHGIYAIRHCDSSFVWQRSRPSQSLTSKCHSYHKLVGTLKPGSSSLTATEADKTQSPPVLIVSYQLG